MPRQAFSNLACSFEAQLPIIRSAGGFQLAYDPARLVFEYRQRNCSLKQVHDLMVKASTDSWDSAVCAVLGMDSKVPNSQLASHVFAFVNP